MKENKLNGNETRKLPTGAIVVLSSGEYSSYGFGPVCRATRDIEIPATPVHSINDSYQDRLSWLKLINDFQQELLRDGSLVELDYYEWHESEDRASSYEV